jgi:hypothetical protein
VDPVIGYEERPDHCIKYQNIDTEDMQIHIHRTSYSKHIYHSSMRPLESHQDSTMYDLRHPRQPQHLRYQRWHCGVAVKHTESTWEDSNSEQPFQTIVVEEGPGIIFLLQIPIVNYYGHGLPKYQTHKTKKGSSQRYIWNTIILLLCYPIS